MGRRRDCIHSLAPTTRGMVLPTTKLGNPPDSATSNYGPTHPIGQGDLGAPGRDLRHGGCPDGPSPRSPIWSWTGHGRRDRLAEPATGCGVSVIFIDRIGQDPIARTCIAHYANILVMPTALPRGKAAIFATSRLHSGVYDRRLSATDILSSTA